MIVGGAGNDRLYGEIGNDTLEGGSGLDTFDTGGGFDLVVVHANTDGFAVINDFTVGSDGVRLIASPYAGFTQASAAFVYDAAANTTTLAIDADTSVTFFGVTPAQLTAGSFVFG